MSTSNFPCVGTCLTRSFTAFMAMCGELTAIGKLNIAGKGDTESFLKALILFMQKETYDLLSDPDRMKFNIKKFMSELDLTWFEEDLLNDKLYIQDKEKIFKEVYDKYTKMINDSCPSKNYDEIINQFYNEGKFDFKKLIEVNSDYFNKLDELQSGNSEMRSSREYILELISIYNIDFFNIEFCYEGEMIDSIKIPSQEIINSMAIDSPTLIRLCFKCHGSEFQIELSEITTNNKLLKGRPFMADEDEDMIKELPYVGDLTIEEFKQIIDFIKVFVMIGVPRIDCADEKEFTRLPEEIKQILTDVYHDIPFFWKTCYVLYDIGFIGIFRTFFMMICNESERIEIERYIKFNGSNSESYSIPKDEFTGSEEEIEQLQKMLDFHYRLQLISQETYEQYSEELRVNNKEHHPDSDIVKKNDEIKKEIFTFNELLQEVDCQIISKEIEIEEDEGIFEA